MTASLLEEIVKNHYPDIKNLRINVNEKGFKISFRIRDMLFQMCIGLFGIMY